MEHGSCRVKGARRRGQTQRGLRLLALALADGVGMGARKGPGRQRERESARATEAGQDKQQTCCVASQFSLSVHAYMHTNACARLSS